MPGCVMAMARLNRPSVFVYGGTIKPGAERRDIVSIFAAVGIQDVSQMGIIMDLGTGAMLWANIPIVLGLGYLSVDCLSDYGRRLKAGEFPRTDG